jgi:hypothetical protein
MAWSFRSLSWRQNLAQREKNPRIFITLFRFVCRKQVSANKCIKPAHFMCSTRKARSNRGPLAPAEFIHVPR